MSKSETMYIAFPFGGSIPGPVLNEKEDRKVGPHDPVRVPRSYGEHLVNDRFAYEAEPPKKAAKPVPPKDVTIEDLEARLAATHKAIGEAADLEAKGKLEAEAAAIEAEIAALKKA